MNAALTQPVTASNCLRDVDASATLDVSDLVAASANLARALPSP